MATRIAVQNKIVFGIKVGVQEPAEDAKIELACTDEYNIVNLDRSAHIAMVVVSAVTSAWGFLSCKPAPVRSKVTSAKTRIGLQFYYSVMGGEVVGT